MNQTTLADIVVLEGVALHSGEQVRTELHPAAADSGIVFHVYAGRKVRRIVLRPEAVASTELATTISDGVVQVSTIEHILAALSGLSIDNAEIHAFSNEVPLLDGSALQVVEGIHKAGILELDAFRRTARLTRACSAEKDGKFISAEPFDGFVVDYTIRFSHPAIGEQRFVFNMTPKTFEREIARARTFGFFKEVEYLRSRGLARGGSLQNAVVVGNEGVMNEEGLRFSDEFVRHKILDFIGDMAMLGMPLKGSFRVSCSGHAHNNAFLRRMAEENALEIEEQ